VVSACDCNEARRMLETQPPVQAVVTDRALPDGDWRAVLEIVAQGRAYVQVVVCSRSGDHTLLIDVLERGGYDVLVEPYRREEIRRVLEAAAARSDVRSRPLARMTGYKTKAARAAV
jgi:DNA-binding NtrC family response regulator